jgi:serine/threonine-protein kinase RsbW
MLQLETNREPKLLGSTKRMRANEERETACQLTMTIPADPAAIPRVTNAVTQVLAERTWREDDVMAVELALTEALANAIRHGCHGDVSQDVRCSVTYDESDELVIVVRDPGSGFDPGTVPDPLDSANTLNPGGRGIFLMHGLMDHVRFADGGREVQMRKRKGL